MSIRPLDEQKCPLDIHMSICPMDEQKCPVDIQMSIGHLAEVLDMYALPKDALSSASTSYRYWQGKKQRLTNICKIWQSYHLIQPMPLLHSVTECKIMVTRTKLSSTRRKFAVCKVVQKGDWTELLDYEKVPPLQVSKKRSDLKALHVQTVKHKGQKHKLLLAEDGTV